MAFSQENMNNNERKMTKKKDIQVNSLKFVLSKYEN